MKKTGKKTNIKNVYKKRIQNIIELYSQRKNEYKKVYKKRIKNIIELL